jgi:hypothetical protein
MRFLDIVIRFNHTLLLHHLLEFFQLPGISSEVSRRIDELFKSSTFFHPAIGYHYNSKPGTTSLVVTDFTMMADKSH